jgi:hypothetical protein
MGSGLTALIFEFCFVASKLAYAIRHVKEVRQRSEVGRKASAVGRGNKLTNIINDVLSQPRRMGA